MNDELEDVKVVGRKFKPVAFGVTVVMIGLAVAALFKLGTYSGHATAFTWVQAIVALVAAGMLSYGWFHSDLKWTRYGLAAAVFAYLMRTIFLMIEDPLGDSVMLAVGFLIIIAGSYVLEAQDYMRSQGRR